MRDVLARFLAAVTTVALVVAVPSIASSASVEPVLREGNPTCSDLGYRFSAKYDAGFTGTVTLSFPDFPPGEKTLTLTSSDGVHFDWASDLGLDAVIVKGSDAANVYFYDPEAFSDTNLQPPDNSSGGPAAISHVDVCYDFEVTVDKTAVSTFTRTWEWDITKSVTPAQWSMFSGDSGTSRYTVSVEKTGYTDGSWAVAGDVTVFNDTPFPAAVSGITDTVSGVGTLALDCGVTFPYTLAAGGTLTCSYGPASMPDGASRTNTAVVTTAADGKVLGGEASAGFSFTNPTTQVDDEVNVEDTNGMSWGPVSDDASWSYTATFSCDGDEGAHGNIAAITETGQSDDATVSVSCSDLEVVKDASTSFNRYFDWTVDKAASDTALVLSPGQQHMVTYAITLGAGSTDGDFEVSGRIWVTNSSQNATASLNGVTDMLSTGGSADVDCGVDFPYNLGPGATLVCSYSGEASSSEPGDNTATATLNNFSYSWDGTATYSGSTSFQGAASYSFDLENPDDVIDGCVDLYDDQGDPGVWQVLAQPVCLDSLPYTFSYDMWFGPYTEADCDFVPDFVNIAKVVEGDSEREATDPETVSIDVVCAPTGGCTLTPGYWKTHSFYGPAPYDDTWLEVGEDTPFFLSGQSWYEVLWTSPKGGNVYYILAHAYIAAVLNGHNGADISDVENTLALAAGFFDAYTPDEAAGFKGRDKALREEALSWAAYLDAYNNGLIGPPHCSE